MSTKVDTDRLIDRVRSYFEAERVDIEVSPDGERVLLRDLISDRAWQGPLAVLYAVIESIDGPSELWNVLA